jgi:hypothetical protein
MSQEPVASEVPATSIARESLGGLLAALIALGCLLPPLLHFVTGPLGPFIGGFIVGNHLKPEARGRAIIGITLGVCLAGLGGAVAAAIASFSGPKGLPDWFPSPDQIGLVLGIVALYGSALGAAGATFGAGRARRSESA